MFLFGMISVKWASNMCYFLEYAKTVLTIGYTQPSWHCLRGWYSVIARAYRF